MSDKTYPSWESREIKIRVTDKLHEELHNIADHQGETVSNLIRPKLREIANSFPQEMKLPLKKED